MSEVLANDGLSVEEFRATANAIVGEVGKVIVGQVDVLRHVLIAVIAGGHVLLEGVPGLGKTTLIRTLGDTLNMSFSRIQFTPDLMPADITGTDILDFMEDGKRALRFQKGPIFANLVLADEINRATPKTQSALLEAMQEKTVTTGRQTYSLDKPFFVLATQNPLDMDGTYRLPEAQLDRFMFKIIVNYPSASELVEIMDRTTGAASAMGVHAADSQRILNMGELARRVPVPSHVSEYVARLTVATHPEQAETDRVARFVQYGASPRGAQSLILGAKINALLAGRYNVAFDDVKAVAPAVLRHRLLLNRAAGSDYTELTRIAEEIIGELLEKVAEQVR